MRIAVRAVSLLVGCGALIASPRSALADGGVYTAIGVPGLIAGYALPVTESIIVRADLSSLGSRGWTGTESGNEYQGKIKFNRAALLGDYNFKNGLRLTGGFTTQNARLNLHSSGAGLTNIGGTPFTPQPGDSFDATVKFPRFTPYLGVGFGRYAGVPTGWNMVGDAGVMVGKSSVSGGLSGPSAGLVPQSDVDAELQKLQDNVGKIKVIPQLTVGASYQY